MRGLDLGLKFLSDSSDINMRLILFYLLILGQFQT